MLAIRMQRTGRKGHRYVSRIVQDSRRTPTSGKIVAQLGSYDHMAKLDLSTKETGASFYLTTVPQPSERAARLLQSEGVKRLMGRISDAKAGKIRHADSSAATAAKKLLPIVPVEEPAEARQLPKDISFRG